MSKAVVSGWWSVDSKLTARRAGCFKMKKMGALNMKRNTLSEFFRYLQRQPSLITNHQPLEF